MALPDFKKTTQDKKAVPEWAKYLSEGEFISYENTYKTRQYLDLFDKYIYPCEQTGDIRYYVYDPVKHGADKNKKYLAYQTTGSVYNPANIAVQLDYLLEELNDTLMVLKEER